MNPNSTLKLGELTDFQKLWDMPLSESQEALKPFRGKDYSPLMTCGEYRDERKKITEETAEEPKEDIDEQTTLG